MRCATLLAVPLFAACAVEPGASDAWSRIQRDRLERLHAPRRPDAALTAVIAGAPATAGSRAAQPQQPQQPQQPGHIDQREPAAPGTGPRPFQAPVFSASLAVGAGSVGVRMPGLGLDDRADARTARLELETGGGAALHASVTAGETELFPAERISDGTMPAPADASLLIADAFPHLRVDTIDRDRGGRFRLPLRLGAFADWRHLDHELANVDRQWLGLGPRVVAEPTWRAVAGGRFAVDVVGSLGGDAGIAFFRERFPAGDDRDTTVRWGGEAGLTLRVLFDGAHAEVGYRVQHTVYGPTDGDLFGDQHRTEQQLQQVFVGFGLTF
jgi:hypothetical protein